MDSDNGRPGQVAAAVHQSARRISHYDAPKLRPRRQLDRALPGPKIDIIRDGIAAAQLRAAGGKAVYTALWSTAASASQRGWDQWEWEELLVQPQSRLGQQMRLRDGRTQISAETVRKTLDRAWDEATAWVSEQEPPATRQELLRRVRPALTAARRLLADPGALLAAADREVLAFACSEIDRRGLERVTLPWRAVRDATGLGERTVKSSLRRLVSAGHLLIAVPGRSGAGTGRRATIYRLPDGPVPKNGTTGPHRKFHGTSSVLAPGIPSGNREQTS